MGFPGSLGYKRSTKVSLNLTNTTDNVSLALETSQRMRRDVISGCYVKDINHYFPYVPKKNTRKETSEQLTVTAFYAWQKYLDIVLPTRKPNTSKYLKKTIHPVMCNIGNQPLCNAQGIYTMLRELCSTDMTVRVLGYLKRIIHDHYPHMEANGNPYNVVLSLARQANKKVAQTLTATMIPSEELDEILALIKKNFHGYYCFAKFIALTGCRPTEAAALQWHNVSSGEVTLGASLVSIEGNWTITHGSKNNKSRQFPVSQALYNLIDEIPRRENPHDLVFLTKRGKPIALTNFSKNVWRKATENYTLYNLRDTFITKQVENGTPLAIIGQWCDNSEAVIQKHYLGKSTKYVPV